MEPTDANLEAWNARFRRPDEPAVPQRVRDRLPPLEGLRVLLIEGAMATGAELAADGALVTLTREHLADSADLPVVQTDPAHLPSELLRARFDVVYLEPGALSAVRELDALLTGVHAALRPLGWLVVYDTHPACADDYFEEGATTLGDLVTAVAQAGLAVKRLEEYPARRDPRVPGEFLLRAEKPDRTP
jgi:hypothetical protein